MPTVTPFLIEVPKYQKNWKTGRFESAGPVRINPSEVIVIDTAVKNFIPGTESVRPQDLYVLIMKEGVKVYTTEIDAIVEYVPPSQPPAVPA